MRFGQTQVVSVVIIIGIALAAVATVLPWAYNVIQKRKDAKTLEDAYSFFQSLDKTIRNIAESGGEERLTLSTPGLFTVYPASANSPYNNSIIFFFQSKVSNIAECDEDKVSSPEDCWIPLNTPNVNESATLGVDTPSVIFGMADISDTTLDIKYRLWYRKLVDPSTNKAYQIILNTTDDTIKSTSTGFLSIQRIGSKRTQDLITTEINIII